MTIQTESSGKTKVATSMSGEIVVRPEDVANVSMTFSEGGDVELTADEAVELASALLRAVTTHWER